MFQKKMSHPEMRFDESFDEYDFLPERLMTEEQIRKMQSQGQGGPMRRPFV